MITIQEVKEYLRIDIDEDDLLLQSLITAAIEYLKNATGKEYLNSETENYELEKIYLKLLIAHWYEERTPMTSSKQVGKEFSYLTKSLLLQLQNR